MALYKCQGKIGDEVATASAPIVHSSFTAINQSTAVGPTSAPCSSVQEDDSPDADRTHNPTIARYLGLGSASEKSPFEESVVEVSRRKRHPRQNDSARKHAKVEVETDMKKVPKQRLVSVGLRQTKSASKTYLTPQESQHTGSKRSHCEDGLQAIAPPNVLSEPLVTDFQFPLSDDPLITPGSLYTVPVGKDYAPSRLTSPCMQPLGLDAISDELASHMNSASTTVGASAGYKQELLGPRIPRKRPRLLQDKEAHSKNRTIEETAFASNTGESIPSLTKQTNADTVCATTKESQRPLGHISVDYLDAEFDNIFLSLDLDHLTTVSPLTNSQLSCRPGIDDGFDDGIADDDLLELATTEQSHETNETASDRRCCLDADPDTYHTLSQGALPTSLSPTSPVQSSRTISDGLSKEFVSPLTTTARCQTQMNNERTSAMSPIVRPSFPPRVRDRSPVIGLTPEIFLRTCFRVGEAIKEGSSAAKSGKNAVLELYARVLSSKRDESRQRFVFCDLFHTKMPYIQASYEATIWKGVELFDYDSGRLLQEGRMCRCIGRLKRNNNAEWELGVLNIWEATWNDVQWVLGIVNS